MANGNKKKKKHSAAEKRAFYRAQGFAAAKAGKRVKCSSEKEKQSFRNGVKSGKGVE